MLLQRKTYWVAIALPPPHWSLAGGISGNIGKRTFPQFLPDGAIAIRNILIRRCFMPIDGLNGKSKSLVLRQFLRTTAVRLIICAQLVAASNVESLDVTIFVKQYKLSKQNLSLCIRMYHNVTKVS